MKRRVDKISIEDLTLSDESMCETVREEFFPKESALAVHGLTMLHTKQRVYRARQLRFGATILGQIEKPPLSLVRSSTLPFFRFHNAYSSVRGDQATIERMVRWDIHFR